MKSTAQYNVSEAYRANKQYALHFNNFHQTDSWSFDAQNSVSNDLHFRTAQPISLPPVTYFILYIFSTGDLYKYFKQYFFVVTITLRYCEVLYTTKRVISYWKPLSIIYCQCFFESTFSGKKSDKDFVVTTNTPTFW